MKTGLPCCFVAASLLLAPGAGARPSARVNGCTTDDIVYFNSKYAEMIDLFNDASEYLALLAATNGTAAAFGAYVGGVRSDAEADFAALIDEITTRAFAFSYVGYRRDRSLLDPDIELFYPDRDAFLSGIFDGSNLVLPGFYAIIPLTQGRFLNTNGGQGGYSRCRPREGTATTSIRTIDLFVATDPRTDVNGDERFESEVVEAKVAIEWKRIGRGSARRWRISQITMAANNLGYLTYNYTAVAEVEPV